MTDEKPTNSVRDYYDDVSSGYSMQYNPESYLSSGKYPQNFYRLQIIAQRLSHIKAKSVYEVGVGEGTPLANLSNMGLEVAGCDISQGMIDKSREAMASAGVSKDAVQLGNIEDFLSISNQVRSDGFDALIALGVMPHVNNDGLALRNMRSLLAKGGKAFIEFRNKLFSLFTFNEYSKNFFLQDLLQNVPDDIKSQVAELLDKIVNCSAPSGQVKEKRAYDKIQAKFHNPLELPKILESEGFREPVFHWYHFHPAPPVLQDQIGNEAFFSAASKLEHQNCEIDWRGYFLCSAVVVEVTAD